MLQIAVDTLHFVMIVLFVAAITICTVVYLGRGSKTFGLFGAYFGVQLVLEMIVHTSESTTLLARKINELVSSTVTIKGMFYGILVFLLLFAVLSALELPAKKQYLIPPAMIAVWLLCLPMLRHVTMMVYWIYLLPCEAYYFCIALIALRRIGHMKEQSFHPVFRKVMALMMIFSVIILAEDIIAAWQYGFLTELSGFTNPELGMAYVKERSYSESILQIIFAVMAIYIGGKLLLGALTMEPSAIPEMPVTVSAQSTGSYADSIGLSQRERELLPLLLDNLSIQEIAQQLYISVGTVKSHTHNIYQKAGVNNRTGLIAAVGQAKSE